jgi:hypothetical protein
MLCLQAGMFYAVSCLMMVQESTTEHLLVPTNTNPQHSTRTSQTWLWSMVLLASTALALLAGCGTTGTRYVEEHDIKQLKVVFLDERSLHERWSHIAGRDPVRFATPMNSADPIVKTVLGFYDYSSNTLYCEKWNFEVCGHELHHAALGQFHPQH